LHATTSQLQWIVDAYNLVFAAFVLAAGSLSDRLKEKSGVGSAVNDATRVLGATLGVAVIGSVYASLYASRLTRPSA